MLTITEPGIYYDLPANEYHAQHDWLSWSRMKHLLPPSTPAHFNALRSGSEERNRNFDLGKIVHTFVLGEGDQYDVVQSKRKDTTWGDAASYDLVSAQQDRDRIYSEGKVPLLRHELNTALSMAASVQTHPIATRLLAAGKPEVSLFWIDATTGAKCKARLDWLPDTSPGERVIGVDLKTAADGSPKGFAKAAASFGYFGQQIHYGDGMKALGIDDNPAFVFVVIEKAEPHLVSVNLIDSKDDLALARASVDHCRRLYAECTANDTWPGYSPGITRITLPTWLHYDLEGVFA